MSLLQGWLPPTRENWELAVQIFGLFPLGTFVLWASDFVLMGKHSVDSRLNVPGKIAWFTMEVPGFVALLTTMVAVQRSEGLQHLPNANWLMAGLYTTHYVYRAIIGPFISPSISPVHISAWGSALFFNVLNGIGLGGWLGGYGPRSAQEWAPRMPWIQAGLVIFLLGFAGNIYHDEELRELRRSAAREQKLKQEGAGKEAKVEKVYKVPQAGLFQYILYPHYLCEWFEWTGFWMIGGLGCVPARSFVANELTAMMPQAISGRRWYIQRFGKEKIGSRKAVIPGLV